METGHYRLRDLFLLPGLLSLARIPLAIAFPFVVESPSGALAVLALAGLSDVLDGWCARRLGQVTPTGVALDPISDKLFVLTVAVTLIVTGHLSVRDVVLLSTRELGELPLVLWFALSPRARRARARDASANLAGKLATALQFATVSVALLRAPSAEIWIVVTAVAGVLAALTYWRRALRVVAA